MDEGCSRVATVIITIIGLIASIISIYVFLTGIETLKDSFDRFRGSEEATSQSVPNSITSPIAGEPVVSPDLPLLPLSQGNTTFSLPNLDEDNRIGFSFVQGKFASEAVPADITFTDCYIDSAGYGTYCKIESIATWSAGKIPLNKIMSITEFTQESIFSSHRTYNFRPDQPGETYIVETYDGRLAKFRTNFYETVYGDFCNMFSTHFPCGITFTIEWIYQPNDRQDFLEP